MNDDDLKLAEYRQAVADLLAACALIDFDDREVIYTLGTHAVAAMKAAVEKARKL